MLIDSEPKEAGRLPSVTSSGIHTKSMLTQSPRRKRFCRDSCSEEPAAKIRILSCGRQSRCESNSVKQAVAGRKRGYPDSGDRDSTCKKPRMKLTNLTHHVQSCAQEDDLSPDYNAFNFWKPVLPNIDLELDLVEESKMDISNSQCQEDTRKTQDADKEFNNFIFWKDPIPDIDLDLESL